jgi:hypothetical protein
MRIPDPAATVAAYENFLYLLAEMEASLARGMHPLDGRVGTGSAASLGEHVCRIGRDRCPIAGGVTRLLLYQHPPASLDHRAQGLDHRLPRVLCLNLSLPTSAYRDRASQSIVTRAGGLRHSRQRSPRRKLLGDPEHRPWVRNPAPLTGLG